MATINVPLAQIEPRFFGETVILTINAAQGQRAAAERNVATALSRTERTVAFTVRTFDQFIDATVTQERLIAMLSSFFGGLALLAGRHRALRHRRASRAQRGPASAT